MGEFLDFVHGDFKYKLYIPNQYKAEKKAPLMVMLHGCTQDPDDFAAGTNMNQLADQENFLVLYPNMNHMFNPSDPTGYNPLGCWNWFLDKNQHRGMGHPKLIFEIINEVKSQYSIDNNQVYAVGLSAGASLACIMGVTYPDVFSGIGICSGMAYDAANVFFLTDPLAEDAKKSMEKGVPDPYICGKNAYHEMGEFKKKMPVIVFHGLLDTTVHPINGQHVIIQWAQANYLTEGGKGRADVTPLEVKADMVNGKSYTQHVYGDRKGEPLMELWMIDQMGHTWSGGSSNGSYSDPSGPNATEIIWNFFVNHQQRQAEKPALVLVGSTIGDSSEAALEHQAVSISDPSASLSEFKTEGSAEIFTEEPATSIIEKETSDEVNAEKSVKAPAETAHEGPASPSGSVPANPTAETKEEAAEPAKRKNKLFGSLFSIFKRKKK